MLGPEGFTKTEYMSQVLKWKAEGTTFAIKLPLVDGATGLSPAAAVMARRARSPIVSNGT